MKILKGIRKLAGKLLLRGRYCSRKDFERLERRCDQLQYMLNACMPDDRRQRALEIIWNNRKESVLDLDNPRTFGEKIQWIKLHGADPLLTRLADKYSVRDWISERIGEKYLVRLLGAWTDADRIDFEALPAKFVLKASHGYHMNIIVTDKSKLDVKATRATLKTWLKTNFAYAGRLQMQYERIVPRVIAEEYIENFEGQVFDYKLWCFKGRAHYVQFLRDRGAHGVSSVFFDRDWKPQPFTHSHRPPVKPLPARPDNLEEMIALAEKLSAGFEFVRVDFYRLNDGTVKFGEMTFTPANGYGAWDPPEMDLRIGQMFDIRPGNRIGEVR